MGDDQTVSRAAGDIWFFDPNVKSGLPSVGNDIVRVNTRHVNVSSVASAWRQRQHHCIARRQCKLYSVSMASAYAKASTITASAK